MLKLLWKNTDHPADHVIFRQKIRMEKKKDRESISYSRSVQFILLQPVLHPEHI